MAYVMNERRHSIALPCNGSFNSNQPVDAYLVASDNYKSSPSEEGSDEKEDDHKETSPNTKKYNNFYDLVSLNEELLHKNREKHADRITSRRNHRRHSSVALRFHQYSSDDEVSSGKSERS